MIGERPARRPLWSFWPLLLFYIGIAVCTTWPLAARLTTHLPVGTDTLSHYWNGWATLQALRGGYSPYYSPYLFYPTGVSTVYKNYAWLHIVSWLALRPLVGGIAAYNLAFLLGLTLCGLAAFLLVYELAGDGRAAAVAGMIYQAWPYRMTQPSHPNLISTAAIPLFLLFLRRVLRRGRWQDGLLAGLCLTLVGYTRWQLLIPAAMMGGIYGLWNMPRRPSRRLVWALALAGLVTVAMLAPPALLLAREMRSTPASLTKEDEESIMQTDVLAYVTPPSTHAVLGPLTQPAYLRYYAGRGSRFVHSPYVGLVVLILACVGIVKTRLRDGLPWMVIALLMILLALGPDLRFNGQLYSDIPMFYNLAIRLPGVQLMREPERFNMFLALPMGVLSGYGLAHLFSTGSVAPFSGFLARLGFVVRPGHRDRAVGVGMALVAGAILFEYLVIPFPLQTAQVSTFYAQLAAEPGWFAVLNVPVDPYASKPYMYAQAVHEHPIVQGRVSRYPEGIFDYLDSQPWIRAMRRYTTIPPVRTDIGRQLNALAEEEIRYLIVHKSLVGEEHWARWERYLILEPRFEDEDMAVYTTTPVAGQDFELAYEWMPGVGVIRVIMSSPCVRPGQMLDVDVAWGTRAPPARDLNVELALVSPEGTVRQAAVLPIAPDWPSRDWPANAVAWGYYSLQVPEDIPVGVYDLTLVLTDPETGLAQGGMLVVGKVHIQGTPCVLPVPDDAVGVNALFGDAMRLLGYRLDQETDRLNLTLFWRPERRMGTDYKVFVHVYDSATGVPVAQNDAMPLHWTYPTTYWVPGEVVTDEISISTGGVQRGVYGIAVGVYDPANGERLPVRDDSDQVRPDGRLVFPDETVRIE
jgi:hypothetical protein